ncbi:MAG: glycosyltransferase [Pseudomonadota bacterium]
MPSPSLAIVVPVHNGGEQFRLCLEALGEARNAFDELIVVADGDSDGSCDRAEEAGVTVLRLAEPGGPARARNRGVELASSELILFVDADVLISGTTIERIVQYFRDEPALAALIGSYDDEPGEDNFLSQYRNLLHHFTHQESNADAFTFWGACGAVRRDVFRSLGGFDESYRTPSIEDIELGHRLKKAGHRIRLAKEVQVKHLKHWDVQTMLRADFFYRALPWTDLILRQQGLTNDLNLKVSNRLSVALSFALVFLMVVFGIDLFMGFDAGPTLSVLMAALLLFFLVLNWRLYRFFSRKRGLYFALAAIPWHFLFYLCSGLAFTLGFARARFR